MSLFIYIFRENYILSRLSELTMQLMDLQQKQVDYDSYAASIGDGTVSLNDLMECPASMFNRMSLFMFGSHAASMTNAQQKFGQTFNLAQSQGVFANMQQQQVQQYQQSMFKSLYDQGRENFRQTEQKILNKEDLQIKSKMTKIQDEINKLEKEQDKIAEAKNKEIERTTPKYVA